MAIQQAHKSDYIFKHGAVLVRGRTLISKGFNSPTRTYSCFHSVHAEMKAIKLAKVSKQQGTTMFVVRVNAHGLTESKPCKDCQNIMKSFGVLRVYYSTCDGIIENMYL
jgi:deoxycytidylate deaminase